jgi:hypothetical protein
MRLLTIGIAALALTGCATRERIVVRMVNVPVPVSCPAADDLPAKPIKPDLPANLEAALRTAVAHAARLSGWGDDLAGRLTACRVPGE